MRRVLAPFEALEAARGRLLPWAPLFLSFGIGLYFALPVEPGRAEGIAGAVLLAASAGLALAGPRLARLPATAVALCAAGLLLILWRAHAVAAPVLSFRYYGPVEGRIVDIDRSFSDKPRILLDQVVLSRVEVARTPARVRVALHDTEGGTDLQPGLRVILTAHLSPPDGPVEPGGFDFQRLAWFSSLGGVGYSRAPVLAIEAPEGGLALIAFRMRMALSRAMQATIPGQPGAFAAALMTGDRSGVDAATNESLRASNLSHMISISGLHMGLLTGFVFATLRYGLALVPPLALRLDTRKAAALVALAAATFYLVLAGPDVATRRSYIMAAVMLVAILADRRAISLRSVAVSALIVLGIEPESLIEPGFQMSFGATAALVVAFERWPAVQRRLPRLVRPAAMLVLSSLAAGLATAPIAAAHFNRIAEYGLLANLIAVPVMGIFVMPMGVIAAILAPLGLAGPALWVMGLGTAVILGVGDWVAGLDGAVSAVPRPPDLVLPLLGTGGFVALVARRLPLRAGGVLLAAGALALWAGTSRPALLVAADGALVGVLEPGGRVLSKPKGAGFIAESWLQDDGDLATQEEAHARGPAAIRRGEWAGHFAGRPLHHLTGKTAPERAVRLCGTAPAGTILVLAGDWPAAAPKGGCTVLDQGALRRTGALAISGEGRGIITARDTAGRRLWNAER